MDDFYVDLAVSILLRLLQDSRRAKKYMRALIKLRDALNKVVDNPNVGPSAMEPKVGA